MFPALFMWSLSKRAHVKTEASFAAQDPWNENRRASFTIESYVRLGRYLYGIRSEVDGIERMLPECLECLWRSNRVPAESLPRLLKEMQPMLKKTDFRFQVLTKGYAVMGWIFTGLLGLNLVGLAAAIFAGSASDISDFVTLEVLSAGVMYLVFFRPRARRRRQIEWALAHL